MTLTPRSLKLDYFAYLFRQARHEAGFDEQQDVLEALPDKKKIDANTLSDAETGKRKPRRENLDACLDLFKARGVSDKLLDDIRKAYKAIPGQSSAARERRARKAAATKGGILEAQGETSSLEQAVPRAEGASEQSAPTGRPPTLHPRRLGGAWRRRMQQQWRLRAEARQRYARAHVEADERAENGVWVSRPHIDIYEERPAATPALPPSREGDHYALTPPVPPRAHLEAALPPIVLGAPVSPLMLPEASIKEPVESSAPSSPTPHRLETAKAHEPATVPVPPPEARSGTWYNTDAGPLFISAPTVSFINEELHALLVDAETAANEGFFTKLGRWITYVGSALFVAGAILYWILDALGKVPH